MMRLQNSEFFNTGKSFLKVSNTINRQNQNRSSFGSNNGDSFVKKDYTADIEELQKDLLATLKENTTHQKYSNILEELTALQSRNEKMADITQNFKFINIALSNSSPKNISKDTESVVKFLEEWRTLGKDKGFNRISGYYDIKKKLDNEFVLKTMMMARTSQKIDIPNALIVYGPFGNGKSLFAKALAEQSLSELEIIDPKNNKLKKEAIERNIPIEQLVMDKIVELAKKSKERYINDKDGNQRTIILLNEADIMANPKSPAFMQFRDFLKDCAEKYKCTLFLTTNYPMFFATEILSKEVTPYKIGIAPPDRATCKAIVTDMLTRINKLPEDGVDIIVNALFKNPNIMYSNANIAEIIETTLSQCDKEKPLIKDYLDIIKKDDVRPSISRVDLDKFYQTKAALEPLTA